MNRKEQAQMDRLQDENRHLREQIDKHMEIYRQQLYQIVAMQTRYDRINALCTEIAELGAYGATDAYGEYQHDEA